MEPGAAEESSNTSEDRGWGSLPHTLDNHSIQLAATVMTTTAMTLPPQKNFSVEDTTTTSTTGETMNFPVEGALYLPSQFNVTQEEGTPAIVAGDNTSMVNSVSTAVTTTSPPQTDPCMEAKREDEMFLLEVMERDDITVVSQGLADGIDLSLWTPQFITNCIGSSYHHKICVFKTTNNETLEEDRWYSMKVSDFFRYLAKRADNHPEMFTFIDCDDHE